MKLILFFPIFLFSFQSFSAGIMEVCNYGRDNNTLSLDKQYERVREDAQFVKCWPGINKEKIKNNGIKECFFYTRKDHRPAFKNNIVPCVKMICSSSGTPMDADCQNYNKKKKRPEHTTERL